MYDQSRAQATGYYSRWEWKEEIQESVGLDPENLELIIKATSNRKMMNVTF
jgi:hypothetical protein